MKGNKKIIDYMNLGLAEELLDIKRDMVSVEITDEQRQEKLIKQIERRAIAEVKHAEKCIARNLFLAGRPVISNLKTICTGDEVPVVDQNDRSVDAIMKEVGELIEFTKEQ